MEIKKTDRQWPETIGNGGRCVGSQDSLWTVAHEEEEEEEKKKEEDNG